jgi:hypothetical protein
MQRDYMYISLWSWILTPSGLWPRISVSSPWMVSLLARGDAYLGMLSSISVRRYAREPLIRYSQILWKSEVALWDLWIIQHNLVLGWVLRKGYVRWPENCRRNIVSSLASVSQDDWKDIKNDLRALENILQDDNWNRMFSVSSNASSSIWRQAW